MNQDELRAVVLAALLDYEILKKKRRLRAFKKALQGTMVATVIGSTGILAASQGRNQVRETAVLAASNATSMSALPNLSKDTTQQNLISAAALFDFDSHALTPGDEDKLTAMAKQLPKDAELTIIGCTDALGNMAYNKKLGKLRAQAVANFLAKLGITVKTITSQVSQNSQANWLARRVDIVVDSTLPASSLADSNQDLPAQAKQHFSQQYGPQIESKLSKQSVDYHNAVLEALIASDKKGQPKSAWQAETKPNLISGMAKAKPELAAKHRQKVSGVVHFGLNRHTLASAHKERLMELVALLPKDAELTVIGRTDALGDDDYNKVLGMQRAKSVAIFLANHGIKIKAVGSKVSSDKYSGWSARRVDIVVDSVLMAAPIQLLPSATSKSIAPAASSKPHAKTHSITRAVGKKAAQIGQDATRIIQRARHVFNVPQAEQIPLWWDGSEQVNSDCLDKATSAQGC